MKIDFANFDPTAHRGHHVMRGSELLGTFATKKEAQAFKKAHYADDRGIKLHSGPNDDLPDASSPTRGTG